MLLAAVSVLTVAVILLIAVFDLNSAADAVHARIPYLYLGYIAAGLVWYALRQRKAAKPSGLYRLKCCGKSLHLCGYRRLVKRENPNFLTIEFMPRQLILLNLQRELDQPLTIAGRVSNFSPA